MARPLLAATWLAPLPPPPPARGPARPSASARCRCRCRVEEPPPPPPPPPAPQRGGRRAPLLALALCGLHVAGGAALALPPPDVGPVVLRSFTTPGGVRVQEIFEGSGPEARSGDILQFNYVCRRANGYYVYSTVDPFNGAAEPVQLPLGLGQMIAGLEEALEGMRPGGKRRALVPPALGYVSRDLQPQPKEFGPLRSLFAHAGEPLVFELQLLKVK